MKEKIKKIYDMLKKNWMIVLIVILILSWFSWYEVRPSIIYSYCNEQAKEKAIDNYDKKHTNLNNEESEDIIKESGRLYVYLKSDYETLYKSCLRDKGINK